MLVYDSDSYLRSSQVNSNSIFHMVMPFQYNQFIPSVVHQWKVFLLVHYFWLLRGAPVAVFLSGALFFFVFSFFECTTEIFLFLCTTSRFPVVHQQLFFSLIHSFSANSCQVFQCSLANYINNPIVFTSNAWKDSFATSALSSFVISTYSNTRSKGSSNATFVTSYLQQSVISSERFMDS